MFSIRCNRWTVAAAFALAALSPSAVSAQTPDHPNANDSASQFPTKNDLKSLTQSGSYLAARHAGVERDAASAAAFYRSALRNDPKNNELLDRAFISSVADGDIEEAVKLGERILTVDKSNRVARLVVGVQDLKLKKYAAVGLGQLWCGRRQDRGGQHRQADRAGMVSDLQGPARRHDFRAGGPRQGCRRALRARLQARRLHAARERGLCALAVAQQGRREGDRDL
jgi:hypothetical protein